MKKDITDKELRGIIKKKRKQLKKEKGKKTRFKEGDFQELPHSQYTIIPNRLLEALYRYAKTLTELKILLWLVRETYGRRASHNKRRRWVKLPRLEELEKRLNRKRNAIWESLNKLKERGIILEDDRGWLTIKGSGLFWRKK